MAKKIEPVVVAPPTEALHRKPTHDGRLQYYKVLQMVMASAKMYGLIGDYAMQLRGLREWMSMISPYCQPNLLSDVPPKITKAQHLVRVVQRLQSSPHRRYGGFASVLDAQVGIHEEVLDDVLMEIEAALHYASKDMMLPLGGVDEYDLDVADVLSRSGL